MNMEFHIKQLRTLIFREFWEHKIAIFWVPVSIGILCTLALLWGITREPVYDAAINQLNIMSSIAQPEARVQLLGIFGMVSMLFLAPLYLTIPIYLLVCLYDDRKTGASLFWYSLPVSNAKTVASKLLTALVLMPLSAIAILLLFFMLLLLISTVLILSSGLGAGLLWLLIQSFFNAVLLIVSVAILTGLWLLPFYGWLLLVSAFARAVPFFWAVGVVIALAIAERVVFSSSYFSTWLDSRGIPYQNLSVSWTELVGAFLNYDMLYGLVLGSVLIVGAIYMRRYTD